MAFNKLVDNNLVYPTTLNTLKVDNIFTSSGTALFYGGTQGTVGLIAKQSQLNTGSDIFQVQLADGSVVAKINPSGEFSVGAGGQTARFGTINSVVGTALAVQPINATNFGIVTRAATSQTADLQQWQSSGGTSMASVTASGNIWTNSSYAIAGATIPINIFGITYSDGTNASTSASGGMSTNAGFSTPVMLPNEEGYYPYWGFKIPNVVETSNDGTTWTSQNPTSYRGLFAFLPNTSLTVSNRFIRFTFYQPTFTFLSVISARFVGGTNGKGITIKTETLGSDYSTVLATWGPDASTVAYDGSAMMQKVNEYAGNIYATRVTFDMTTWIAGDTYNLAFLMAYLSKPGTGFGFQSKFPFSWDVNKALTLQPNNPSAKPLIVKGVTLSSTISGATANGTTITYTTSSQHSFLAGHVLAITGIVSTGNPSATAGSGFNISAATVASVISQTQFTVTNSLVDTYTSGGTAAVGQGVNLQEWQNSSGTALSSVNQFGAFGINGSPTFTSFLTVFPSAATNGIVVKGASGQTANLQEWQDSNSNILARIASTGQFLAPSIVANNFQITASGVFSTGTSTAIANTQAYILSTSATNVGVTVRGAASQSANLEEWQNNGGTVLARVDSGGVGYFNELRIDPNNRAALRPVWGGNGGVLQLQKGTASTAPGATDFLQLGVVAGTNPGTLKLVVRAGTAGAETTILDNIPQT